MKFAIYPYKTGSNSVNQLAASMGCKIIKHQNSKYRNYSKSNWWTINWGSSHCPSGNRVLNSSINVVRASNKLSYFNLVNNYCRIPEYTEDKEVAKQWIGNKVKRVVCRQTLTGHSGQGIVIVEKPEDIVSAPLYTMYIPKDTEYRFHFIAGKNQPFFVQRKAKKKDFGGDRNPKIRNVENGYVFVHEPENVGEIPGDVLDQASAAFGHSQLDFAAIDVIYNRKYNKAYVLEANTAPGLEGETIVAYANQFKGLTK